MGDSAIWHPLMIRRNTTSELLTIQEFRGDKVIIITDVFALAVSQTMTFGHFAKGSLVEVCIFNAGSLENWYAGVSIFPKLQSLEACPSYRRSCLR
jgi:hypothetical protein